MADATITARVRRGAEWLDRHRPGWPLKIDLIVLNLGDPECCVIGQIDGGYGSLGLPGGPRVHGFESEWSAKHQHGPFDTAWWNGNDAEYKALTTAWRDLIEDRLTAEVRRIARACCPCRGAVCDSGCTCTSPECPKTEAEVTDDDA